MFGDLGAPADESANNAVLLLAFCWLGMKEWIHIVYSSPYITHYSSFHFPLLFPLLHSQIAKGQSFGAKV